MQNLTKKCYLLFFKNASVVIFLFILSKNVIYNTFQLKK